MEPQQQQTDQESGNNMSGSLLCRQTSTRWTPKADQIRILKDLYYKGGVRSPTTEQIQKISARLRQYGKIEGKNVFYWFQNHKARERQKKRFNSATTTTSDHNHHHHHHHVLPMQRPSPANNSAINGSGKFDHQDYSFHNKYPNLSNGYHHPSSGSECVVTAANGLMGSYGYGSINMEKHFRKCSISPMEGSVNHNRGWVSMSHHYSSAPYSFFDRPKPLPKFTEGQEDEKDDEESYLETKRTLPLFPMPGEDHIDDSGGGAFWRTDQSNSGRRSRYVNGGSPYASLDLSLSSYTGVSPD